MLGWSSGRFWLIIGWRLCVIFSSVWAGLWNRPIIRIQHSLPLGHPSDHSRRYQEAGVTLETLDLTPGTWRSTFNSTVIRPCLRSSGCMGGPGNASSGDPDSYCGTGHTGPLCSGCDKGFYWGFGQKCVECGNTLMSGSVLAMVLAGLRWNHM